MRHEKRVRLCDGQISEFAPGRSLFLWAPKSACTVPQPLTSGAYPITRSIAGEPFTRAVE